jgi:hypothetical protein
MNRDRRPDRAHGSKPTQPRSPARIGGLPTAKTRVFINYRRQDSRPAAEHLHASLAERLGTARIFRDLVTIEPGQEFPVVIDQAIRTTSVFIAIIGRRWLTITGRNGQRRLDDPKDPVRLEIESAFRHGVNIIPVLVDGAKMPTTEELPKTIADLTTRNAYAMPWHEEVAKLARRVAEIDRDRVQREKAGRLERKPVDLTHGISKKFAHSVTGAMELSLAHQGHSVRLDPRDLTSSLERHMGHTIDQGFLFSDLIYVIDFIGVKAKSSNTRYVARSYPIDKLNNMRPQLELKRPILAGVNVYGSWFRSPSSKTGIISHMNAGALMGATLGIVVAWEARTKQWKIRMPWANWGNRGVAILNQKAAQLSIFPGQLRSIEVVQEPAAIEASQITQREKSTLRKPKKRGKQSSGISHKVK